MHYPIELKLASRQVVVIGGGKVAARKIASLVECGADVRVVSPNFVPELAERNDVRREVAPYDSDVLDGAELVFACTDHPTLNAQIAADARSRSIWCNVADNPEASDFFVPAAHHQGPFTITVSTGGASPQMAASVRDSLASNFGPQYGILTEELGRARRIVQDRVADPTVRCQIFDTLCKACSLKLLAARDRQAWRKWFERVMEARLSGQEPDPDDYG